MAPLTGGTSGGSGTATPVSDAVTPVRVIADQQAPIMQLWTVPGTLVSFSLSNNAPSARWARFYDSANLTSATNSPVWIGPFMLPASDTFTPNLPIGLGFKSGLAIVLSAGPGDDDLTPILDGDVIGFVGVR